MAKENRTLLFLKSTGVLIGEITPDTDRTVLDLSQFNVRTVSIDEDVSEYWHGDFENGSVKSRLDKPVIVESMVKYSTNTKILTTYPIHNQINIIIDMLKMSNIEKTPEFIEMVNYLDTEVQKHKTKVANYANNPDAYVWVSSDDEENAHKNKKV